MSLPPVIPLSVTSAARGLFLGVELVTDREARTPAPREASYA